MIHPAGYAIAMMWTFAVGDGATRYLVAAHLDAHSSMALVATEGFTVARWRSGHEPAVCRGQWISPMADLRFVVDGHTFELDVVEEERLVKQVSRQWH